MTKFEVQFASYGAIAKGNENKCYAKNVKSALQEAINLNDGIVSINNSSMGDPCKGYQKHFGAQVKRDGEEFNFACLEGQTIDFHHGGTPTSN